MPFKALHDLISPLQVFAQASPPQGVLLWTSYLKSSLMLLVPFSCLVFCIVLLTNHMIYLFIVGIACLLLIGCKLLEEDLFVLFIDASQACGNCYTNLACSRHPIIICWMNYSMCKDMAHLSSMPTFWVPIFGRKVGIGAHQPRGLPLPIIDIF